MRRRRVKITGIGPVTPAGIGREAFWRGIQEPISRVREYHGLGESDGPFVATFIDDFSLKNYLEDPGTMLGEARHTQFALAATALALRDADIGIPDLEKLSVAVMIGSSVMDFGGVGRTIDSIRKRGAVGAMRRTVYTSNTASISGAIVKRFGIRGKAMTFQTSCCAGLDAIGFSYRSVANGEVDVAICGGTEAPLYRTPLLELRASDLTPNTIERADKLCRPFDMWRTTGVVGEGAAVLVLEPESSPRPALAWFDGYGFATDTDNKPLSGLRVAAESAIVDAGLRKDEVQSLNAWGPGHRMVDAAESAEMVQLFGLSLASIAAVSIKGGVGSPLGAAGAMQAVSAALALSEQCIPPTVNWDTPDPACPLSISNQSRYMYFENMLINSHGLSGANACALFRRS
jgi:3-oxoacyl-[acyl-carrier-protein] synthase II